MTTGTTISALDPIAAAQLTEDAQLVVDGADGKTARTGATTLPFLSPEAGAVLRGANAKMADIVSVLDFGATGDGVTNDRSAIVAAIAAVTARGGAVYFPVPTSSYKVDATAGAISVPPGVTLRGENGVYRGSRVSHSGGAVLFDLTGGFETRMIDGLVIRGGTPGSIGIRCRASETRLNRITFDRWTGDTAIVFDDDPGSGDGPWNCHVYDLQILTWTGAVGTIEYGIRAISNFNASTIRKFSITGAGVAGIQIEHGAGWVVADGNLEHNESVSVATNCGIRVGGGVGTPIGGAIRGLECEANYDSAIYVTECNGLLIDSCYAMGNGFHQQAPYGIKIVDASGTGANVKQVTVIGGAYATHATADIYASGTSSTVLVNPFTAVGTSGSFSKLDYYQVNGPIIVAPQVRTANVIVAALAAAATANLLYLTTQVGTWLFTVTDTNGGANHLSGMALLTSNGTTLHYFSLAATNCTWGLAGTTLTVRNDLGVAVNVTATYIKVA